MAKQEDVIRVQGVVIENMPNATFKVEVDGGLEVLARAAGKMRRGRYIRILPGDRVDLELSAYDPRGGASSGATNSSASVAPGFRRVLALLRDVVGRATILLIAKKGAACCSLLVG